MRHEHRQNIDDVNENGLRLVERSGADQDILRCEQLEDQVSLVQFHELRQQLEGDRADLSFAEGT